MFIIRVLRSSPVMLNIPNVLLNLLPGLGRKDGRWYMIPSFVAPRAGEEAEGLGASGGHSEVASHHRASAG